MADILILEPDAKLGAKIRNVLNYAGHHCQCAKSIPEALTKIATSPKVLTLLNARLPWSDSFSFLKVLGSRGWPVLFMTSGEGNTEHLKALYQGASAVLVMPFSANTLIMAVGDLVKSTERTLTLGGLSLDVEEHTATLDGQELTLTAQEFALLHALMQSPDAALTREQLLRTAWGYQGIGETRTVDVHVQRLRRKLGFGCIETVYKLGYRLKMA